MKNMNYVSFCLVAHNPEKLTNKILLQYIHQKKKLKKIKNFCKHIWIEQIKVIKTKITVYLNLK